MDYPHDALRQFAEHASRYSINLNGQVSRGTRASLNGGNAIVHQGTLQPDGTRVAIKTPRGGPPSDDCTIARVLKEVHLCSKLCHPNVISVLGITTEFEQTVSIVSLWMERGDARDYVQNMAIDPCPLILDIAQGLQYLHTRQDGAVFHGDLKSANVLISDDGRALLADFGLSFLVDSTFSIPHSDNAGWSLYWTAPEILDGGEKSAAGDIWSFGMTLLELFTRQKPFHQFNSSKTVTARILHYKTPDRPSDEETCSRLTDEWWAICQECWNPEPSSRPTITHVLEVITNIQQQQRLVPTAMW